MPLDFRETFATSMTAAGFYGTFLLQSGAVIGISGGGYLTDRLAPGKPLQGMLLVDSSTARRRRFC